MYDTFQVKMMLKYKLLFGRRYSELRSKESVNFGDLMDRLWLDFDTLKELTYINGISEDLKDCNYTISDKLSWDTK